MGMLLTSRAPHAGMWYPAAAAGQAGGRASGQAGGRGALLRAWSRKKPFLRRVGFPSRLAAGIPRHPITFSVSLGASFRSLQATIAEGRLQTPDPGKEIPSRSPSRCLGIEGSSRPEPSSALQEGTSRPDPSSTSKHYFGYPDGTSTYARRPPPPSHAPHPGFTHPIRRPLPPSRAGRATPSWSAWIVQDPILSFSRLPIPVQPYPEQ